MKVGGASGPLYARCFMTLGKELGPDPSPADLARALDAAVLRSRRGARRISTTRQCSTCFGPLADHLAEGRASFESVRKLVAERTAATVPMKAIKGRASFLGDRSIGHMDPGARSSQIMIETVCDVLEGKT